MHKTSNGNARHSSGSTYQGELLVQSGRSAGARHALKPGVTLLGQADGCAIRLNAHGVAAYHCALIQSPNGLLIRDLGSEKGTVLNGEMVVAGALREGDLLVVGPFQFRVQFSGAVPVWPSGQQQGTVLYDAATLEEERAALRIQAAAVAAQQAAVTEQEGQLDQRRLAFNKQQDQLGEHLETRNRQLASLLEQVRSERNKLQAERDDYQRTGGQALAELQKEKQQLHAAQQQLERRRKRVAALPRRLKQRWRKHWDLEYARFQERERQLAEQQIALDHQRATLQEQQESLHRLRLRTNGALELERQRCRAERQQLEQESERRARATAELQLAMLELDNREQSLRETQKRLEKQKSNWERSRLNLEKEAEGLVNRISNLRLKLAATERQGNSIPAEAAPAALPGQPEPPASSQLPSPVPDPLAASPEKLTALQHLAGELADQRLYLAEECERLAQSQQIWNQQRLTTAQDFETAALRLQEREQAIIDMEQAIAARSAALQQRQEELRQTELNLEADQSRLATHKINWRANQTRLLDRIRAREEMAERRLAALQKMRDQWTVARRVERTRLNQEFQQAAEMQGHFANLRHEYQQKLATLHAEQRTLTARMQAMEKYRLDLTIDAASPAAERRLDDLTREHNETLLSAAHDLEQHRQALHDESKVLEERFQKLEQRRLELEQSEQHLFQHHLADESVEQAAEEHAREQLRIQRLDNQRLLYQRQVVQLNAELERVINSMLGDEERQAPSAARAA